jgi:hypothetical protein
MTRRNCRDCADQAAERGRSAGSLGHVTRRTTVKFVVKIMDALLLSLLLTAPGDAPRFDVHSPLDEPPSGQLARLTRDFTATLKTTDGPKAVADVISLRRTDCVLPAFPTGPHLVTTAGDRIVGTLIAGDSQSLQFRPTGVGLKPGQAWKVPLSSAVVLWLTDTPANTPLDASRYEWLAELKNQDVLRFRNADTARGTIDGLVPDTDNPTFPFRPARGELRSVDASELTAVAFNPALARFRKPKGPYARIVLIDGSRLSLTGAVVADGVLNGVALFGESVQLPLTAVVAIETVAGKGVYLSDLKPTKVELSGFLGVSWRWSGDRTVRGGALRVTTPKGETTADRGLGTHPRTTLTYDLGGRYRRFEALVGLDPDAPAPAKVAVRVLVDGIEQKIPGLQTLTGGDAIPVRIDVRGAKELVLVTDFGPAGGVGGDVNWADARLVE